MTRLQHIHLMAEYNQWMNAKFYAAAATLPNDALFANRGAFFGSIIGTLNHLVVGDTIWLKRFSAHSAPFPALAPGKFGSKHHINHITSARAA